MIWPKISVAVLAVLAICKCSHHRLACKIEGYFGVVLNEIALATAPIANFKGKTKRQCLLECLSTQQGTSVNYNRQNGDCIVLKEGFSPVTVGSLQKKPGWSFISSSGKWPGNTCSTTEPCQNDGVCVESCDARGYKCTCDEFHYGVNCEKDLQTILNDFCHNLVAGTQYADLAHARYDGSRQDFQTYLWRCYGKAALTGDGLYYSRTTGTYSTKSGLGELFKKFHNGKLISSDFDTKFMFGYESRPTKPRKELLIRLVAPVPSEYSVGAVGTSCTAQCTSLAKNCNRRMLNTNTVYVFHLAGVNCKHPYKVYGINETGYYRNADEPSYAPTTGYCFGFAKLPREINCDGKSATKRRLCRCT
eukprot:gene4807-5437_t